MTTCLGTLEKKSKKIQFNLKRESLNKKNEIYWTKFYREKEEQDAGAGTLEFISGEGFYKNLIGKKCNYAIKYFRSDVFFFNKFVNYKL